MAYGADKHAEVQRYLERGDTQQVAAEAAGVSERIVRSWKKRGFLERPKSAEIDGPLPPLSIEALLRDRCQRQDHEWLQGDGPQRNYAIEETYTEYGVSGRRRVCAFCGHVANVREQIIVVVE